jgi:hypothetical protein
MTNASYRLLPNGLARTFAGTSVGFGTLTAKRQAATMAQATVAPQIHQAFDVHRYNTTQVTLDGVLGHLGANEVHLTLRQAANLGIFRDTSRRTDLLRGSTANSVDVAQRKNLVYVILYVYTSYTGNSKYSSNK